VHTRRLSGEKLLNGGSITNEVVVRFSESGKTYALGFWGYGDGAT